MPIDAQTKKHVVKMVPFLGLRYVENGCEGVGVWNRRLAKGVRVKKYKPTTATTLASLWLTH